MSAARLTPVLDAEFADIGEQRRTDRRAPRLRLDTLFAATLVNHVTQGDVRRVGGYGAAPPLRAGVVVNLRA
ncbi:MAG: hypothetical protein H7124_12835 [Phycisphaerales bacterium]|nr:hypothetical protein [Hyphomonadaceae bacterium]